MELKVFSPSFGHPQASAGHDRDLDDAEGAVDAEPVSESTGCFLAISGCPPCEPNIYVFAC
jgi:hypothetical protein